MKLKNIFSNENGNISVIAVTSFMIVIGMCALVIDLGFVYAEATKLQNAADAAVYSVALNSLPLATTDGSGIAAIEDEVTDYIIKNGVDPSCIVDIELGNPVIDTSEKIISMKPTLSTSKYTTIEVTLQSNVIHLFAPVLGTDNSTVKRSGKAGLEVATSLMGVLPLGISTETYEDEIYWVYDNVSFPVKFGGGGGNNGFFGALDLDGSSGGGANDYEDRLATGYNGEIKIGDIIPVESGNMAGPTSDAFEIRFNACPHSPKCTLAQYEQDCPRVGYIIQFVEISNKLVKIENFLPVILEGHDHNGDLLVSSVQIFVKKGDSESVTNDNFGYGIYTVKLLG